MIAKADRNLRAYYNEIDSKCCAWLAALMEEGWITRGDIDNRSIEDVRPSDVEGYDRVHFFAGIAVWDYALNQAGWGNRPVWTGSCPCQPFSAAGKRKGIADKRHLWPAFFHLISERRPEHVFGEQVASKDGLAWLDLVQSDLEGAGYVCGAVDTCAAGFGAPHIRQRLYWVADARHAERRSLRPDRENGRDRTHNRWEEVYGLAGTCGEVHKLADATDDGCIERELGDEASEKQASSGNKSIVEQDKRSWGNDAPHAGCHERVADAEEHGRPERKPFGGRSMEGVSERRTDGCPIGSAIGELANSHDEGLQGRRERRDSPGECVAGPGGMELQNGSTGPTNGHWQDVDWLFCRDGKWRPTESIAVEMVDGIADCLGYMRIDGRYSLNPLIQKGENRVMRLKGYGNAIVAPQAQAFIEAYMGIMR